MTVQTAASLHITNGDGVLYLLKKAGILGTHIAWRDALNDGPVPAGLTLEETSALRTRYLADRGFGNAIKLIHDFERRDAHIRRAAEFEEVVLWFEHDLFDQLQLLQILTTLEEMSLEPGRVSLIQTDHYLEAMTVDEISPLLRKRRTTTAAIFRSARRNWEQVTSTVPLDLLAATTTDAIGLPFLRSALHRLCEEYPWARDGLSRSQRQALHAVAQGGGREEELFARAQAREEAPFLGKRAFVVLLQDLHASEGALLETVDGDVALTVLGRKILAGDADWLEHRAMDRWIGGVRLRGSDVVRWDDDSGRLV
jgi:hypothetical protein